MGGRASQKPNVSQQQEDCVRCWCLFFPVPFLDLTGQSGPCQGTQNQGSAVTWPAAAAVPPLVHKGRASRVAAPSPQAAGQVRLRGLDSFSVNTSLRNSLYHSLSISATDVLRAARSHWHSWAGSVCSDSCALVLYSFPFLLARKAACWILSSGCFPTRHHS